MILFVCLKPFSKRLEYINDYCKDRLKLSTQKANIALTRGMTPVLRFLVFLSLSSMVSLVRCGT